jgi:hypothetical protein
MKPRVYRSGGQWVVMWIDRTGSAGVSQPRDWHSAVRRALRAAAEGSW